ncbi:MAG TPA: DUF5694 domain-containing protein [Ktedonobacteraceae bacterium]|nr:DUF5694 domain-containing protein [Ktedonobacteraceae bacterium]
MSHQKQSETASVQPVVTFVGSSHWSNPNRDVFNVQHDDMLAPKRQSEIQECIDRLKRFQPTKVAVEMPSDYNDMPKEQYQQYRSGTFKLTANERHQLGYRIAAECHHEQVYAIDWNGEDGFEHDLGVVFDYAQEHYPEIYEQLMNAGRRELEEEQARLSKTTVREQLLELNDPINLYRNHQFYMTMARVGEGKRYVGIGWVQGWYGRNLRIFVNLTRIITSPQDRVLVVYGAGHVPLLSQFVRDSGLYTLEAVQTYLS